MSLKEILKWLLKWRLFTLVLLIPGYFLLHLKPGFTLLSESFSYDHIYKAWASFDGFHYISLAKYGYASPFTRNSYAFFPVFPYLISILNFSKGLVDSYIASALFISHLSLIFALYFLFKLLRLDFSEKISRNTILLMLVFPVSFFFGSVYTESLFLLLSVLVFYLARKQRFFLACLIALVASATRVTGIFLWPVVIWEYLEHRKKEGLGTFSPQAIWLVLPPLGLLSYMKFQLIKTGNALYFVTSQPRFNANRVVDRVVFLHQVFYRYFKMLIFVNHSDPLFFTVLLEFIIGVAFLCLAILSFKYLRRSYAFYFLASYLLPTVTGTFSSMPRYVLVLFPGFILISLWYSKLPQKFQRLYLIANIVFACLAVIIFTRGYFVG